MIGLLPAAKLAFSAVASVSVAKVVKEVVKNNVTVVGRMDKVLVWTGTWIISGVIAETAVKNFDETITDIADTWNEKMAEKEEIELDIEIEDVDVDAS